jgi:RHS repeat-associated protein
VVSGGVTTTDVYAYDAFANLYRRTTTGASGTSQATNPVSWSTNRFTNASYDGVGNTLANPVTASSYTWDSHRMMSGLTAHGRNDIYVYTVSDERIASVRNDGVWRWTLRDFSGRAIRELESTGTSSWLWVEDVVYRDAQVAGTERPAAQGGRRHFHNDHLGTARLLTNHAGQGVSRHDYLPFGIELTSIRQEQDRGTGRENAYRFTGHERDFIGGTVTENANSLDYMHARYYPSTLGRFLSTDPGRDWKVHEPQSWNLYAYGRNNPVSNVDLTGKWSTEIHNALIDKAFPGLSIGERATLKNASQRVDFILTGHLPRNSYQHNMRAPGQTVAEARQKSAAFYDKNIADAREKNADAQAHKGDGTGRSEAMAMSSLQSIGAAIHMVTDAGSPEHNGHQVWDPGHHPFESILVHPAGEETIDPATENLLILQMRSIYETVYGEEERQRATGYFRTGKGQ